MKNTQRQIEGMKKQTIGVEIEMADITRQKAIKVVANYFGTGNTVCHDGGSYDAWSCLDNQNRRWTITRDVSIRADRDEEKAELATPILKYEDIEDLQKIARQLRHAGAVSNPDHCCGVHIHVGANGHTAKTLRNLVNIMASHEPLLKESLRLDSYRVSQRFMLQPDETIYGLGQQQTGKLNQRGQELMLRNENTRVCIPYITSEKGYGLYWDNPSPTVFSDTPQETSFNSEAGLMSDYYLIYKETRLRLQFDCKNCQMLVWAEKKGERS